MRGGHHRGKGGTVAIEGGNCWADYLWCLLRCLDHKCLGRSSRLPVDLSVGIGAQPPRSWCCCRGFSWWPLIQWESRSNQVVVDEGLVLRGKQGAKRSSIAVQQRGVRWQRQGWIGCRLARWRRRRRTARRRRCDQVIPRSAIARAWRSRRPWKEGTSWRFR